MVAHVPQIRGIVQRMAPTSPGNGISAVSSSIALPVELQVALSRLVMLPVAALLRVRYRVDTTLWSMQSTRAIRAVRKIHTIPTLVAPAISATLLALHTMALAPR